MKRLTNNQFIEQVEIKHDYFYDYSLVQYVNRRTKINIICPEHGLFQQLAGAHAMGNGCPSCSKNNKLTTESFIYKAKEIHGDKYDYSLSEYVNTYTKIKITCDKHGVFEQRPNDHLSTRGCPICNMSKGEIKLIEILTNNNIQFVHQKRFPDCKNVKPLPFDFYLPTHNLCIEYHGRQHYEPVKAFGGEANFLKTIHNDKIKKQYCQDNKIKLITIKYTDNIVLNFI